MVKKAQKEIDRLDAFDPFLMHYHHNNALNGLRYEGYLDDLIRDKTIFDTVKAARPGVALDFDPIAVMKEFFTIKKIPKGERTEEQRARFREVDAMKQEIQRLKKNPRSLESIWPGSILRSDQTG